METKNKCKKLIRLIGLFLLFCIHGTVAQTIQTAGNAVEQLKLLQTQRMSEMNPSLFNDTLLAKNLQPVANIGMPKPDEFITRDSIQRKSETSATQKLDSIIIENWNDSSGIWVNCQKTGYTYGKNESFETNYYNWNDSRTQWDEAEYRRESSMYDTHGNLIRYINYMKNWFEPGNSIGGPCSIFPYLALKHEYTYDSIGNRISVIPSYWNEFEKRWIESSFLIRIFHGSYYYTREEWTYNDRGEGTLHIRYNMVDYISQWCYMDKTEVTYDSNGHSTLYASYLWDLVNNSWIGNYKSEGTYNEYGNLTLACQYYWDNTNSMWAGYTKDEYKYDANGKLAMLCFYNWDVSKNNWVGSSKEERTYDANGILTMQCHYNWDVSKNKWVGSSKEDRTYDVNGNQILYIYYNWDVSKNNWVGVRKMERTYDANGYQILENTYNWDVSKSNWVKGSKEERTYDANANRILTASYQWDRYISQWIGTYKCEYGFTEMGNPLWETQYHWNTDSSKFSASTKTSWYYREGNTFTITANSYPELAGLVSGDGVYNPGSIVSLIARPDSAFSFINWTEDGEVICTDSVYTFTVSSDRMIVANFLHRTGYFNISVYSYPDICGQALGAGTYYIGSTLSLSAQPIDGYNFHSWSENGEIICTDSVYSFTVSSDRMIVANFFDQMWVYEISGYSFPDYGGWVEGYTYYEFGSTASLTAYPENGYTFVNWMENGKILSTDPVYTFTVFYQRRIAANFILGTGNFKISAYSNPANGGQVRGAGIYYTGTSTSLTALPGSGYSFVNWTENGNIFCTDSIYTFTVSSDRMIVANFLGGTGIFNREVHKITVYPNPASDDLYIKGLEGLKAESFCYIVQDVSGRVVSTFKGESGNRICVGELSKGLYFLKIIQGSRILTVEKFLKE